MLKRSLSGFPWTNWLKWTGMGVLLLGLVSFSWLAAQPTAQQFKQAAPGYRYTFPRDHAAHKEFKTEWWYYTGHLNAADGRTFGYELTFFRSALDPQEAPGRLPWESQWTAQDVYPAHFAISDISNKQFFFADRLNRGKAHLAGAEESVYHVWNELWFAELLGGRHVLRAEDDRYSLHLLLAPQKPPIIHGTHGISQKADCAGCASHYYSLTRLKSEGVLYINGEPVPVLGMSWMDHEFGSNQLAENQVGWDWFSLQLSDETDLMLYLLRLDDGTLDPNSSGTWVAKSGVSHHLERDDYTVTPLGEWKSSKSGATYPMGWRIQVPEKELNLHVIPVFEDQELVTGGSTNITYWEGACRVTGTSGNKTISGQGYVEMTGYAKAFRQRI